MRTLVQKNLKAALTDNDILISPAAPSPAYRMGLSSYLFLCSMFIYLFKNEFIDKLMSTGEKKNDPLAMYAGDITTVSKSTVRGTK